jgi:hypothetical protein
MPIAELETVGGTGLSRPALNAAAELRNQVRDEVEEIARKQPQQIASQVGQWLKE